MFKSIRVGRATNSSSSHSVILHAKNSRRPDEFDNTYGDGYGWEEFCLTSVKSKLEYMLTALGEDRDWGAVVESIRDAVEEHGVDAYKNLWENYELAILAAIASGWEGDGEELYVREYVDHDSIGICSPPSQLPTFHWYMFLMDDELAFYGGNDNSEDFKPGLGVKGVDISSVSRYKMDGNAIVGYSPKTGIKFRWSPDEYTKSTTPELVDVKITDYCSFGCSFCLTGDTKISTPTGVVPIRDVQIGDEVLTYNHDTNLVETDIIEELHHRTVDEIYEVELENGVVLEITGNHEVWIEGKGYVPVKDLDPGDNMLNL